MMQFFATLAISALALTSAADPPCDSTKLVALATGADGKACTAATGYSAATLSIPVGEALAKVCANANCQSLLKEITAAVPTECTFGGVAVKANLIDKFPAACAAALKSTGGSNSSTTAANATTTTAPSATTLAPATTPEASGAGKTNGSGSEMTEVEVTAGSGSMTADKAESPVSTTTVPTPTPTTKSGASALVATTSVVLVAVAASLL